MEGKGRYVKVDLTRRECQAAHTLCELAGTMLADIGGRIPLREKELLLTAINSLRMKMSVATTMLPPEIVTVAESVAADTRGILLPKM